MAPSRTTPSERNATLRRVAIVLSSLPEATRSRLLGSIGSQFKSEVSRVLAQLEDVDPLEKRRAIQAFRVSLSDLGVGSGSVANGSDEFVRSPQANRPPKAVTPNDEAAGRSPTRNSSASLGASANSVLSGDDVSIPTAEKSDSPLAFLADLDSPSLVAILNAETPQTIAIVLSSLQPETAAGLLHQLLPALQRQTVVRLSKLSEVPELAATELASHFHSLLERRSQSRSAMKPSSNAVLQAILAAMPQPTITANAPASPSTPVASPSTRTVHPTSPIAQGRVSPTAAYKTSSDREPRGRYTESVDTALGQAIEDLHQVIPDSSASQGRQTRATIPLRPNAIRVTHGPHPSNPHEPQGLASSNLPEDFVELSTEQIEKRLIELTPTQLCNALARVNTRKAVLALCGMSVAKVDAALALLPKPTAASVRQQMMSLQTINLREIDAAKAEVAQASFAFVNPSSTAAAA
jgi:flagellar motor switch protein FliG